ncbi:MAG: hypothetical protein A3F33_00110 [Candidatus Woykebacteria bacterium RIFCSPHIGHO2_12_FULL_43_10]|uniref:HTH crp-type domain-containing protein n=2 Tax=Candidatus Woykeibacteriota TaxID=1817899 RepID=A0A1G1WVR4_9BACT|nr:MAG: hypothetical protein A2802_01740 [Candidatus Woykebacteria bacterium RIFCSPHIGHO2_01_FULL_43_29]OGY29687.1 MAG: hypothetical protein A3J50_04470 [Candidatus Woykebacteria bacterium RIFCSPHIGHO2_02_FULL_43_16b]OGY30399.1 MAG: hypothetical protein A3F33_00110 [Candidatus Woykebacteria bacterium RIFCSPHIGHO2_12_FULL_43_10]OGY31848.1 MAG: hypothetical protein A3A61_02955 [Candidatus Woykebacteria bacterium RIFCSPLOWO2_01_FULL_43_14]
MSSEIDKRLNLFFEKYLHQKFAPGQVILHPGEINSIHFLKKGKVSQYSVSEEGQVIFLHIFKEATFFPIMLVLAKSSNSYYFQAGTNVETYSAPKEKVIEFLKNNPEVLWNLVERFSGGINGLLIRLEDLLTKDSYLRLKSVLKFLGIRLGTKDPKTKLTKLDLTHTELSAWLGVNRETVTRQMSRLERDGFITYQGKNLILNPQADNQNP